MPRVIYPDCDCCPNLCACTAVCQVYDKYTLTVGAVVNYPVLFGSFLTFVDYGVGTWTLEYQAGTCSWVATDPFGACYPYSAFNPPATSLDCINGPPYRTRWRWSYSGRGNSPPCSGVAGWFLFASHPDAPGIPCPSIATCGVHGEPEAADTTAFAAHWFSPLGTASLVPWAAGTQIYDSITLEPAEDAILLADCDGCCADCDGLAPPSRFRSQLFGVANAGGCGVCAAYNNTYNLDRVGTSCVWRSSVYTGCTSQAFSNGHTTNQYYGELYKSGGSWWIKIKAHDTGAITGLEDEYYVLFRITSGYQFHCNKIDPPHSTFPGPWSGVFFEYDSSALDPCDWSSAGSLVI
jgi:hypothetical protein